MVEQQCNISPILVFNSGPKLLNLKTRSFKTEEDINACFKDKEDKKIKRYNSAKELPGILFNRNPITNKCCNKTLSTMAGNSLLACSSEEEEQDEDELYLIKRCFSIGSSENVRCSHDGGRFKPLKRRMSDSLLHNLDSFRRSYACKTADERTGKSKGPLWKHWIAAHLHLFNKNTNSKPEITDRDQVASPRIGRNLLLPMMNRPWSYFDVLKGRRSSDPSCGIKINNHAKCDRVTYFTDSVSAESHVDKKDQQNGLVDQVCLFKQDDIKIQTLLEEILRSHLLSMREYSVSRCDQASRCITKLVTRILRAMKENDAEQVKAVCQVYLGAVEDDGMFTAVQALWDQDFDNFASASFRNDAVFGVIAVLMVSC